MASWLIVDGASVFHGFTAVAELKLEDDEVEVVSTVVFHGFTAVAELKLGHRQLVVGQILLSSTASPPWPN